jgi:hypothetical protein
MKIRLLLVLLFGFAGLLLAAGCGNAAIWGSKSTGQPAQLGGAVSVPLGKK